MSKKKSSAKSKIWAAGWTATSKKLPSKLEDFINVLVGDAEALGKFIKDPDEEMEKAEIPPEDRQRIKNLIGFGISQKLVEVEAHYVN